MNKLALPLTEGQEAALGGFYFLTLFIMCGVLVWWLNKKFGPGIRQRKLDRKIETAMRLGMVHAEAEQRVARKLQEEQRGMRYYDTYDA